MAEEKEKSGIYFPTNTQEEIDLAVKILGRYDGTEEEKEHLKGVPIPKTKKADD